MEQMVTVKIAQFDHEAQFIKSRLRAAHISCFLQGNYGPSLIGHTSWKHPLGGIEIKVNASDLAAAQSALQTFARTDEPIPRLPWHGIITYGLRQVPLPLRILLIVLGAPYFLFTVCALAYMILGGLLSIFKQ